MIQSRDPRTKTGLFRTGGPWIPDSEWELLSQNGFLDLILIIASFITISQLIKASFQIVLANQNDGTILKLSKASFSIESDLDFKPCFLLWIFDPFLLIHADFPHWDHQFIHLCSIEGL